jgi:hypothetical protein
VEARPDGETAFVFEGLAAGLIYILEMSSRDPLRRYCVSGLAWGDVPLDPGRVRLLEEPTAAMSVEISPCAVLVGRASGREAIVPAASAVRPSPAPSIRPNSGPNRAGDALRFAASRPAVT